MILSVENIIKKFGNYTVSNNISFNLNSGTIFGLLGPNGAGKTTLIRMICNIFPPDAGRILLFDEPISIKSQERLGYLPEERGLYKKAKIIDQITYFGQLKGMTRIDAVREAKFWLDKMGASSWANKKVEELSKGMQQKVQFISTIVHNPEFVILDEPFSGFDPVNAELLKNIILEMKMQGKAIILSTHIMSQVEEMCDEICMLNKGNVVLQGKVQDIKQSYKRNTIQLEFSGTLEFNNFPQLELVSQTEGSAILKIKDTTFNSTEFLNYINSKADIYKFAMETPSINDIFIEMVNK